MKRLGFLFIASLTIVLMNLNYASAQQRDTRTKNIHQAIIGGDLEYVKTLISNGANINEINRLGGSPLHTALLNNKFEIAVQSAQRCECAIGSDPADRAGPGR